MAPDSQGPVIAKATWKVTGQQQVNQRTPNSQQFVQGWRVLFSTSTGTTGWVFVPDSMYTPSNVATAIAQKVAVVAGVNRLNG